MFILFTSIGTLPIACTASEWKITPRSRHSLPISAIGCSTPISLLAAMIVTRIVLSPMAALQVVEINQPILLHGQIGHAKAELLQMLAGVEHRLVFGGRGDDVVALLAIHLGHALDGEVVAFGGARCEDDLFGGRADQPGDTLARQFDRFFRRPSKGVIAAGGVAELSMK